jgi:hypothetical protein
MIRKALFLHLLPAGLSLASLNMGDWDWAKGYKFDNDKDNIKNTVSEEPKMM